MRLVGVVAFTMIASMVSGCSMSSQTAPSGPNQTTGPTAAQRAELEAANARFKQAFAGGYKFAVVGTAASASVSTSGVVTIAEGTEDRLTAILLKMPSNTYRVQVAGTRTPSFFQTGCADSCYSDPTPVPSAGPLPTMPPNSDQCVRKGGVAWSSGAQMGCLNPGESIPFCGGTWQGIAAGRGRFTAPNHDFTGSWAAQNENGCVFGG